MGEAQLWDRGARRDYLESMFQLGTKDWPKACAMEWISRVHNDTKKDPKQVTLRDIQSMISGADPNAAIESHLPSFVPLDYVDHVYAMSSVIDRSSLDAIKKHGIKCSEVSNPKETVIREMSSIQTLNEAEMRGYSFAMPSNEEIHIPIDLGTIKGKTKLCFTALTELREGRDEIIFELKDLEGKEAKFIVFTKNRQIAHGNGDILSIGNLNCDLCEAAYPVAIPGLGVYFSVEIDNTNKKCTVEYTSLFGVDRFEVPLNFKPRMFTICGANAVKRATNVQTTYSSLSKFTLIQLFFIDIRLHVSCDI